MKLSGSVREERIASLKSAGWNLVADRDAIYKELIFKDFNEVCVFVAVLLCEINWIRV